MDQPSEGLQWAVHAAYRKGWEVRLTYYERLLRSVMEMLEAAHPIMKADDLHKKVKVCGLQYQNLCNGTSISVPSKRRSSSVTTY